MNAGSRTAGELAAQLRLHRAGRDWRGACPVCGYADAFVLSDGRKGPVGWCASCREKDAIAAALGRPPRVSSSARQQKSAADVQARVGRAERRWRGAEPLLGTIAAMYLDARGIGHLIGCVDLRFHADCPHPTSTIERPLRLPALIAAVRDAEGRFVGVHRTYLRRDGSGKALVEPTKASLGVVGGGAVRLVPIEQVLEVGELIVAEGIETAASAGLLLGLPAWAAISAGNLARGIVLPAGIRRVVIASDRDPAGQDAARAAWFRFRREGRVVRIATPDEGRGDFNDIACAMDARP
jgi:phage/plasmid primase-like uncharacterized protein